MKEKKENTNVEKPLSKESARAKYKLFLSEEENQLTNKSENLVEAKIKKAMDEGVFKNLKGQGKPIDLSKYYGMPEHLRLGYQILKNAGYMPEEVRLKKEMELIKEKMRRSRSEKSKKKLMKEFSEISQQFNFYMEYNKRFK